MCNHSTRRSHTGSLPELNIFSEQMQAMAPLPTREAHQRGTPYVRFRVLVELTLWTLRGQSYSNR